MRLSQGRWGSVIRRALLLVNHDLQILSDGPAFSGRARRVVRDHAGGFQLPASMTSVVDAPRAVSSDASPTRPLCAVTRASMPAARAAAVKRR